MKKFLCKNLLVIVAVAAPLFFQSVQVNAESLAENLVSSLNGRHKDIFACPNQSAAVIREAAYQLKKDYLQVREFSENEKDEVIQLVLSLGGPLTQLAIDRSFNFSNLELYEEGLNQHEKTVLYMYEKQFLLLNKTENRVRDLVRILEDMLETSGELSSSIRLVGSTHQKLAAAVAAHTHAVQSMVRYLKESASRGAVDEKKVSSGSGQKPDFVYIYVQYRMTREEYEYRHSVLRQLMGQGEHLSLALAELEQAWMIHGEGEEDAARRKAYEESLQLDADHRRNERERVQASTSSRPRNNPSTTNTHNTRKSAKTQRAQYSYN